VTQSVKIRWTAFVQNASNLKRSSNLLKRSFKPVTD
jgi:hypothetical protein